MMATSGGTTITIQYYFAPDTWSKIGGRPEKAFPLASWKNSKSIMAF